MLTRHSGRALLDLTALLIFEGLSINFDAYFPLLVADRGAVFRQALRNTLVSPLTNCGQLTRQP